MNVDAVIFDKDGTLMDFDAFWVTVSQRVMEELLRRLGREDIGTDALLEALGVHDGVTDPDGMLCWGTYGQISRVVWQVLQERGCGISPEELAVLVEEGYGRYADTGDMKPTCPELKQVLAELKRRGKKLAVVTTDNEPVTRKCLERLGIGELFDRVYTDDGALPPQAGSILRQPFPGLLRHCEGADGYGGGYPERYALCEERGDPGHRHRQARKQPAAPGAPRGGGDRKPGAADTAAGVRQGHIPEINRKRTSAGMRGSPFCCSEKPMSVFWGWIWGGFLPGDWTGSNRSEKIAII